MNPTAPGADQGLSERKMADAFVHSLVTRADAISNDGYRLWHGWAIFDGFMAGYAAGLAAKVPREPTHELVAMLADLESLYTFWDEKPLSGVRNIIDRAKAMLRAVYDYPEFDAAPPAASADQSTEVADTRGEIGLDAAQHPSTSVDPSSDAAPAEDVMRCYYHDVSTGEQCIYPPRHTGEHRTVPLAKAHAGPEPEDAELLRHLEEDSTELAAQDCHALKAEA